MSDLRSQLQAIYQKHGKLTAELVVETARPKNHPLHDRIFDRPQKEAAEAWYLHRADELIRSITVKWNVGGEKITTRWFSPTREDQPGVFDPLDKIAENPVAMDVLFRTMEREWKSMLQRYEHLEAFWAMVRKDAAA